MANTNPITKRNIYTALAILVENGTISTPVTIGEGDKAISVTPDNIKAFAVSEVALLDKRNKARADKPTKAETANAEIIPTIVSAFAENEVFSSAEVAEKCGLTLAKAASVLSRNPEVFQNMGKVVKGKSGKVNGYKIIVKD